MSGNKYGHRPYNWFEAIVNKLGGEEAAEAFLRGDLIVKAKEIVFQVFMIMTLGLYTSVGDLKKMLQDGGFLVSDWANDILKKIELSKTQETVDLVVVSVAELGFKNGATLAQIYERAKELGLQLCPAEVGPAIRLAYKNQPMGEWLMVAMEPVRDSGGFLRVFDVARDESGAWLYASCGDPDDVWSGGSRFVFRK